MEKMGNVDDQPVLILNLAAVEISPAMTRIAAKAAQTPLEIKTAIDQLGHVESMARHKVGLT